VSVTKYRVDYYNVMTNLLHTSVEVLAPDEESAIRRANQRFGNLNHEDATGEFYRSAVTPLATIADDASGEDVPEASPVVPEASPVTLADVAAGTPVASPAPVTWPEVPPVEGEDKATRKARLQAELDALSNEG
jgi:hypothetical protein